MKLRVIPVMRREHRKNRLHSIVECTTMHPKPMYMQDPSQVWQAGVLIAPFGADPLQRHAWLFDDNAAACDLNCASKSH